MISVKHFMERFGPHRPSLQALAQLAADGKMTLLHQCSDARHNTATVLRDVMEELAVCQL